MALLRKIFLAALIAFLLLFVSLVIVVRLHGKAIIEKRAALMLHRAVTVGESRLDFPFILHLTNVNVEGLLWADEAKLRCHLGTLLGRSFHLAQVDLQKPILTLHRTKDQGIIWAEHFDETHADHLPAGIALSTSNSIKAVVDVLTVKGGQIYFPDHSSADDASKFSLSEVNLTAKNVPLSGQAMDVGFDFLGMVEGEGVPFANDSLQGSGWINWPNRNMDAAFKVINPQGKMDVELSLNAKNNDLMVRGHVKTRRMSLKSKDQNEASAEQLLLNSIMSAGMEVNLDFSFPTKMDRWELRNIDFSGNLNASDEGKTSAEKVEALKNIGEQFKAVGETLYEKYNEGDKK